jgi:hypothetical protein
MDKIVSRSKTIREMLDSAKYCCTGGHSPKPHCGHTLRAEAENANWSMVTVG